MKRTKILTWLICSMAILCIFSSCLHKALHTHTPVFRESTPATCVADGVGEHWECESCGKLFADANGQQEITKDALILTNGTHSLLYVPVLYNFV